MYMEVIDDVYEALEELRKKHPRLKWVITEHNEIHVWDDEDWVPRELSPYKEETWRTVSYEIRTGRR